MKKSPSWEAKKFQATLEIPRILSYLKIHYRVYKCPTPAPNQSQINPVHDLPISLPEDPS